MQGKIIKRSVDALKAKGGRPSFLWDGELKGFGVKATPNGRKVYLLQYRLGGRGTPTKRYTIGPHGALTPEQARTLAEELRGDLARLVDPAKAKAVQRSAAAADAAALTVAEFCDRYIEAVEHGEILTRWGTVKKASTFATDKGRIIRHIKPLLGRHKVHDVTQDHIERFKLDVVSGKTAVDVKTGKRGRAIVEGGRGTATRTLGLLGGMFTWAVKQRMRPDNPVRGVERYADQKGQRFLSHAELGELGSAITAAQMAWDDYAAAMADWLARGKTGQRPKQAEEAENPIALTAIRLLLLTGCRKSEILTLQWAHVDVERGCLRLPDSKTGARVVPLGAAALEALAGLRKIDGNPYVLPGEKEGHHLVGLPKVWERLRKHAKLNDVRLHDLRHGFASIAAAGGDSLVIIGGLLGHRDPKTTSRYAHLADHPLKAAADRISGSIASAMSGKTSAEVVPLTRPRQLG